MKLSKILRKHLTEVRFEGVYLPPVIGKQSKLNLEDGVLHTPEQTNATPSVCMQQMLHSVQWLKKKLLETTAESCPYTPRSPCANTTVAFVKGTTATDA